MAGIAIVGDAVSVSGFRPLGFATYAVERPEQSRDLWGELSSGLFAVVLVTEPVYEALGELVHEVADKTVPALTVIPGVGGAGGVGGAKIERAIERALGTKLVFGDEER